MELYKKYRSNSFSEMIGDFSSLDELVRSEKCPHAFLFSGSTGNGKTTTARIIKNMLGVDDMDYHEYNTANTRGIDTIRAILERMNQTSFGGGPIMYVLDECHQISTDGQNALLKALEDTPKHVYFILCTSEPDKIIKAIHSRCYAVNFPSIPDDFMFDLIKDVCKKEGKKVSNKVLDKIVLAANGSARKALVILDQILSTTEEGYDKILADNNVVDDTAEIIELCRQIYTNGSNSGMNEILSKLKDQKEEPERIRRAVLGYGSALLLKSDGRNKNAILENMKWFLPNVYDTGFAGLVYACNRATTREVF